MPCEADAKCGGKGGVLCTKVQRVWSIDAQHFPVNQNQLLTSEVASLLPEKGDVHAYLVCLEIDSLGPGSAQ